MASLEFDGRKYRRASAHQREWGRGLIEKLGLAGHESILDLGCGDGTLTKELAACVPHGRVLGIDASQGMIAAACQLESANCTFRLQDINALDAAQEYDVIFSNATLHWIKDHEALLHNAHRALKPGGFIRFNFAGEGNCAHLFRVVRRIMTEPAFAPGFAQFEWPWFMPSVNEYETLVTRSAFRDAKVWEQNADRHFDNTDALVAWIDQPSIVPFLQHLQEAALKTAFRDAVVDTMIRETRQPDGTCFETFRRVNVYAERPGAEGSDKC